MLTTSRSTAVASGAASSDLCRPPKALSSAASATECLLSRSSQSRRSLSRSHQRFIAANVVHEVVATEAEVLSELERRLCVDVGDVVERVLEPTIYEIRRAGEMRPAGLCAGRRWELRAASGLLAAVPDAGGLLAAVPDATVSDAGMSKLLC
ncbi:hypothetical protein ZIOFF_013590 [Zingiber officinale]|uniref:Uncharacterized protein n=1 Tax=Zingiber officinale TaxID=94328 RepID=A0A8J5HUK9_ZINOF|nr:hypothetical protein ZIOFF_013590 [Zingiber officinale]